MHVYRKSVLSPLGAYLHFRGGLIREGGFLERGCLFKTLDEEDIYDSFTSLLPHILRIQDAILLAKYIDSTDFYRLLERVLDREGA